MNVPKVAVILAAYNGEQFIFEQLSSIADQKNIKVDLYISDDGSSDKTIEIINKFAKKNPSFVIKTFIGPRKGFVKNFFSILNKIETEYEYYAFSDQDDLWDQYKIYKAILCLKKYDNNIENLYFSRTKIIDSDGNQLGMSPNFKRKPAFKNALVQSIGGGNTCVFNKKTFDTILKLTLCNDFDYVSHDWLIYMVITAIDGNVFFDKNSYINYRQHKDNIIGSNKSLKSKYKRFYDMFVNNVYVGWNDSHIKILDNLEIHPKNKDIYVCFKKCRDKSIYVRTTNFFRSGIYRQQSFTSFLIFLSILFRKF